MCYDMVEWGRTNQCHIANVANRIVLWDIEGTLRWQKNYQGLHWFVYINNVGIRLESSFPYFLIKNHILQMYMQF
jgi:hypothetical protein